ncbi:MAG: hypothetical protein E7B11_18560, partial [Clostridiales bacterium]|nr:hypothetical protein [Clostridiales bacterium]
ASGGLIVSNIYSFQGSFEQFFLLKFFINHLTLPQSLLFTHNRYAVYTRCPICIQKESHLAMT